MADEVLEPQGEDTQTQDESVDYKALYEKLQGDYDTLKENSRKWEKRAKASNTDATTNKNNYESEKERADRLEAELSTIRANSARKKLISETAKEYGVNADVLSRMTGDDTDAIRANAEFIKEQLGNSYSSHKEVKDGGEPKKTPTMTKEEIMAIKDGKKRRAAIAENLSLFEE